MNSSDPFLHEVLDAIEESESRLLVWGLVDGCLTRMDLEHLIDPLLDRAIPQGMTEFYDTAGVIEALRARGLLFSVRDAAPNAFRSRMAESIRLLFRLRQLFSKHKEEKWQQARTLVADFRFLRRRRRYPRRDIRLDDALASLNAVARDTTTVEALTELLAKRPPDFKLASFQLRAAERILSGFNRRLGTGTLISAGTGSGKTLAFYVPAIARIAAHLCKDAPAEYWVKCLAIYPRTELLRDQFAEIFREARRLRDFLKGRGKRPLRIGALFGGTLDSVADLRKPQIKGWRKSGKKYFWSLMPCPVDECKGDLFWPEDEAINGRERLICDTCGEEIGQEVVLTRQSLADSPPDILFTTTEMLNQRMNDHRSRHLFGLKPQAARAPELMLLDEVHTYAGFHGAQVAYLLRRWKHLVEAPVSFVGLSATIRDGANFFSALTGVPESRVAEILPRQSELVTEGAEYMLALRGDPVSRASLLSTTIQTCLLMSRALDRSNATPSGGIYGSRIFAFTDDIDVNNRLYHNLLDAEGRDSRGLPDGRRHPSGGLARLRESGSGVKDRFGQDWWMPRRIGHLLSERKRIGRTSSQDPGVGPNLDVIVATASLEVGFNDPTVGAIIQHKAPRDVAQFLQRKGRAGRLRGMRPWTIVVLSDYGRDRIAYQAYDQLFDPELMVRKVPMVSRYVQRIQAVYALIDYLASGARGVGPSVWQSLSGPYDRKVMREELVTRLAAIVDQPAKSDALHRYLQKALGLASDDIDALMWEHPRPLLTTVVPTALRRLSSNWRAFGRSTGDFRVRNSPLPEFAPASLFADLNLPEVRIVLPAHNPGISDVEKTMPIAQAMRTFAPGRVSRRFGTRAGWVRHWLAPEQITGDLLQRMDLDDFASWSDLGIWQASGLRGAEDWNVIRINELRPVQAKKEIRDTSNALLEWHTQIATLGRGLQQEPPASSSWRNLVQVMEAFTHADEVPVEIRRFAYSSDAHVQFARGERVHTRFLLYRGGLPCAIGFATSVDGLRFQLRMPDSLWMQSASESNAKWRALRTGRFFDRAWAGDGFSKVENPFARQWLSMIYFSAICNEALRAEVSLREAGVVVAAEKASVNPTDVLETIFQSPAVPTEEDDGGNDVNQDELRHELEDHLRDPEVLTSLRELSMVLWEPIDDSWEPWLRSRFKSTVALALLEAIRNLCPDIDSDGLLVDISCGARPPGDGLANQSGDDEIWISEGRPGGMGLIEMFLRSYAEDPRRFYSLVSAALRPNEFELTDYQLTAFLEAVVGNAPITSLVESVQDLRTSTGLNQEKALATLRKRLSEFGLCLSHGFIAGLGHRVMRPGAGKENDQYLYRAVRAWDEQENRLGVELDARTVAFWLSQDDEIERVIADSGMPLPTTNRMSWRFNAIYGLLWPRGSVVRAAGLKAYNPFSSLPAPERLLVYEQIAEGARRVLIKTNENWREAALGQLASEGAITLICSAQEQRILADVLNFFATNPVHSEYLAVFARVEALRRVRDCFELDLEISEVVQ